MTQDEILATVCAAVRDQLDADGVEFGGAIDAQTPLIGRESPIDSFGLVGVIVSVEEGVASQSGQAVSLADEKAMSQRNSPFRTVGTLAEYVQTLLAEEPRA